MNHVRLSHVKRPQLTGDETLPVTLEKLRESVNRLRGEHRHCDRETCPWPRMREEDIVELWETLNETLSPTPHLRFLRVRIEEAWKLANADKKGSTMTDTEKLRAMLAPEPAYPTPWRIAGDDRQVVLCTSGRHAARCMTSEAAQIIVAAVNEFATRTGNTGDPDEVERALAVGLWGIVLTGNAREIAKTVLTILTDAGYTITGPSRNAD